MAETGLGSAANVCAGLVKINQDIGAQLFDRGERNFKLARLKVHPGSVLPALGHTRVGVRWRFSPSSWN